MKECLMALLEDAYNWLMDHIRVVMICYLSFCFVLTLFFLGTIPKVIGISPSKYMVNSDTVNEDLALKVRKTSRLSEEVSAESLALDVLGDLNNETKLITTFKEITDRAEDVRVEEKDMVIPAEASMIACGPVQLYGWNEDYVSWLKWAANFGNVTDPKHSGKLVFICCDNYIYIDIGTKKLGVTGIIEIGDVL